MFHLTYSAHNADGFPRYEEFADLFAVKEFIERSYIEDYMLSLIHISGEAGRRLGQWLALHRW